MARRIRSSSIVDGEITWQAIEWIGSARSSARYSRARCFRAPSAPFELVTALVVLRIQCVARKSVLIECVVFVAKRA